MTHDAQPLPLTLQGDSVLHHPTNSVQDVHDATIQQLIADMFVTMKKERGVGLAATQIGLSLRLAVIDADDQKFTLINPVILKKSPELITFTEGCLSIPSKEFPILRHEKITVRYTDEKGRFHKIKLKGFLAIVFQHEIDHLDGVLIADRYEQQTDMRKEYNITH